jgi:hypothetical protein
MYSPRTLLCGTGGGLLNGLGTFGYIWVDSTRDDALIPWCFSHHASTRTEMCGLFPTLTLLRLVVEYFHIVPGEKASCRMYCDSKAALARVVDKYYEDFGTTWR